MEIERRKEVGKEREVEEEGEIITTREGQYSINSPLGVCD